MPVKHLFHKSRTQPDLIMDVSKLQLEFFREIKRTIPGHLSTTEEIAKLLDVSVDSVYRRMRGEKTLSLEELFTLCSHYKISVDSVFNSQTGSVSFQGDFFNRNEVRYKEHLQGIAKWLAYFNGFAEKKVYHIPRDITIFYWYILREFGAFKYYFWMRNVYRHPDFINRKFSFEDYPDDIFAAGQKMLGLYTRLSVSEFWGADIISGTIRQIDYYKSAGMFRTKEDIFRIYDSIEKLLEYIKSQAILGYRYEYGDPEKKPIGEFQLFYRDLLFGDNNLLAILDTMKLSFVTYNWSSYMCTRDVAFTENMYEYVKEMIKSSTLISSVSEWERTKFFDMLQERIAKRKRAL